MAKEITYKQYEKRANKIIYDFIKENYSYEVKELKQHMEDLNIKDYKDKFWSCEDIINSFTQTIFAGEESEDITLLTESIINDFDYVEALYCKLDYINDLKIKDLLEIKKDCYKYIHNNIYNCDTLKEILKEVIYNFFNVDSKYLNKYTQYYNCYDRQLHLNTDLYINDFSNDFYYHREKTLPDTEDEINYRLEKDFNFNKYKINLLSDFYELPKVNAEEIIKLEDVLTKQANNRINKKLELINKDITKYTTRLKTTRNKDIIKLIKDKINNLNNNKTLIE